MKTRIISACVMLPLLIFVYFGGWFLWAMALAIGIIGVREFYRGFEAIGAKPSYHIAYAAAIALYGANALAPDDWHLILLWVFLVTVASMIYGFNVEERNLIDMTATLMGIMYTIFLSFHMILIDQNEHRLLIWLVLFAAFGTDTFAYFTGLALGKHKLCPHLSPKKSVEGAVGGVIGSVILCSIYGYLVMPEEMVMCIAIGVLGSVVAQLGDLSASAFKRQMGIKDYGNLIPGHGGILDRFDSVLFTAPMVYYCIIFIDGMGI